MQIHGAFIQRQIAEVDRLRGINLMAANHGAQPCQQFRRVERLGEVIIRAGIQPGNPVLHLCPGSQHQAGRGNAVAAELRENLNAAHLRHHPVQNDTGIFAGFRQLKRVRAVVRCLNGITFMLQQGLRGTAQFPVIIRK